MIASRKISIAGGGLAGLSLGIGLRQAGVPVEIFEAGDYPRHRVCGEFVAGLSDRTIARLGVGFAFTRTTQHHRVAWFHRGRTVVRQWLPSPARAVSRFALDAMLAERFVAAGGTLTTGTRISNPETGSGWVHASGRRPCRASPWIGLKLHVRQLATADHLEFHMGDGAYVGLSAVEGGWINVCGLFRRRIGLHFDRDNALPAYLRACGLSELAARVSAAEIRPGSATAIAGFHFDRRLAAGPGVRVGDACATIPPFTGNGMAMAFQSAAVALDPLIAWARGAENWEDAEKRIRRSLDRTFRTRLAGAAIVHPFLWQGALQRSFAIAARTGLLPLGSLYRLLH